MKRFIIGFGWLVAACVAVAGTGTSNEFRVDTRTGVRTAAATEKIQYSTAWATNLTAAQQGESKAVVKVNPCLKTDDSCEKRLWRVADDVSESMSVCQSTNGNQVAGNDLVVT